jgi:hypothetical protein
VESAAEDNAKNELVAIGSLMVALEARAAKRAMVDAD